LGINCDISICVCKLPCVVHPHHHSHSSHSAPLKMISTGSIDLYSYKYINHILPTFTSWFTPPSLTSILYKTCLTFPFFIFRCIFILQRKFVMINPQQICCNSIRLTPLFLSLTPSTLLSFGGFHYAFRITDEIYFKISLWF
jgi:hypothetical protein